MELMDLDLQLLILFNKPFTPLLNYFFLLTIYSVYGFLLALLYHHLRRGNKRKFFHLVVAAISGMFFILSLKYLIGRPRPYVTFPNLVKHIIIKPDPSFPSGHTFMAFLTLQFLPKGGSKWLRALSLVYIFSIPLTSMYIGIHYPSDVVIGALLGWFYPMLISERGATKLLEMVYERAKLLKKKISM